YPTLFRSHLDVLDLVAAHRHQLRLEHQDVGGHQHRVHEQAGGDARIRVLARLDVPVHRRLVGMRAVEDALAGHTAQQPGQLRDLWDVRLPVEPDRVRVQAAGQPAGGDLQGRALHPGRILALDQRVVVGEEVEAFHARAAAGGDGRADGAGVIAQVRGARGGDAGEDAGGWHGGTGYERPPFYPPRPANPVAPGRTFHRMPPPRGAPP